MVINVKYIAMDCAKEYVPIPAAPIFRDKYGAVINGKTRISI